ncbi:hypothetical protein E3T24_13050 [Cryobacterium sp. TmT2-59]|uniref:hypothetical protein n=1 Tax=unclassified Cryobacterium TaxID=2649013 RepID=UPI00106BA240|nr:MULTISPECIES: hypothetical protein [unclassified Cryobacterium]TFC82462.1 hypothetical protein E3T24_13050 [Cryobacterium sp. TmT2-59]TFD19656.1 hypothetical protein E3T42_03665 [Cryobacterium sp. TMT4-10]
MRENDWVLNVHCRECGIGGTAHVGNDRRIVWPLIVHESNCELADAQDLVESRHGESVYGRQPTFAR